MSKHILTDRHMRRLLRDPGNIEPLEQIIKVELEELGQAQERPKDTRSLSITELRKEFEENVKPFVDEYLDYSTPEPGIARFPFYPGVWPAAFAIQVVATASAYYQLWAEQDPLWAAQGLLNSATAMMTYTMSSNSYALIDKTITVTAADREQQIVCSGHEYAHRQQHGAGTLSGSFVMRFKTAGIEGLSIGAERALARHLAAKERNDRFLQTTHDLRLNGRINTYKWLCREYGHEPISLAEDNEIVSNKHCDHRTPCRYCVGDAVYSIRALQRGESIYAQALRDQRALI